MKSLQNSKDLLKGKNMLKKSFLLFTTLSTMSILSGCRFFVHVIDGLANTGNPRAALFYAAGQSIQDGKRDNILLEYKLYALKKFAIEYEENKTKNVFKEYQLHKSNYEFFKKKYDNAKAKGNKEEEKDYLDRYKYDLEESKKYHKEYINHKKVVEVYKTMDRDKWLELLDKAEKKCKENKTDICQKLGIAEIRDAIYDGRITRFYYYDSEEEQPRQTGFSDNAIVSGGKYGSGQSINTIKENAYGLGVHSDQYGRAVKYEVQGGSTGEFIKVKQNTYGPGIHSDQYGRPVRTRPAF